MWLVERLLREKVLEEWFRMQIGSTSYDTYSYQLSVEVYITFFIYEYDYIFTVYKTFLTCESFYFLPMDCKGGKIGNTKGCSLLVYSSPPNSGLAKVVLTAKTNDIAQIRCLILVESQQSFKFVLVATPLKHVSIFPKQGLNIEKQTV